MKPKIGKCVVCNDGKDKPIIKDKCNTHYWQSKRTPLPASKKKIAHTSKKLKHNLELYRIVKKKFLEANPICQFPNCTSREVTLHHSKGRVGKLLYDATYFKALCLEHHRWVEEHPQQAKEMGLSVSRLS